MRASTCVPSSMSAKDLVVSMPIVGLFPFVRGGTRCRGSNCLCVLRRDIAAGVKMMAEGNHLPSYSQSLRTPQPKGLGGSSFTVWPPPATLLSYHLTMHRQVIECLGLN